MQAFKECPDEVIDGSMRVESDAEKLVEEFTPGDSFQFIVRAEAGNLGLNYTAPYTGFDIEVDAVLDQSTEDERVQNAIDRCDFRCTSLILAWLVLLMRMKCSETVGHGSVQ